MRDAPHSPAVADLRREVTVCERQAVLAFRTLQNARTTIEETRALLRVVRERPVASGASGRPLPPGS